MPNIKMHLKNTDTWLRGLFILFFGLIFWLLYSIIWVLVIVQFIHRLFTGELNQNLIDLGKMLSDFAHQILCYLLFQSEERPYPFAPWPNKQVHSSISRKRPTSTKRTRNRTRTNKTLPTNNEGGDKQET